MTPAFELAHVFERGLGQNEAARVLRFVDPQNGEVLALRSDVTPQVARLVCGPMARDPLPIRVSYFGRVFRLRQHKEFQRREITQAGVELIGASGVAADAELIGLCDAALTAAGSSEHRLSIGHAEVVGAALSTTDDDDGIAELLGKKDADGIRGRLGEPGETLAELCQLYGDPAPVLDAARRLLGPLPALDHLEAVLGELGEATAARCLLDLGETLGFGYYTGLVFHAYLPGVGQAVAAGGRYDTLIARYGRDLPAAGFAIDEEGLTEWRRD